MLNLSPYVRLFWEGPWERGWREPERLLYDCELVYVSQGEFKLRIDANVHAMRQGSLAIIPPATLHESWVAGDQSVVRHCIHFDWTRERADHPIPVFGLPGPSYRQDWVHLPPGDAQALLPLVSHLPAHAAMIDVVELVIARLRDHDGAGVHLLYPLLQYFWEQSDASASPFYTGEERVAIQLKQYIDVHYHEAIGSPEFCALTGLSRSHLCQLFSASIGMPPTKYLNRLRLQHACRLLREGELSVKDVAGAVGFGDANYFARFFRQEMGVVPSAYAKETFKSTSHEHEEDAG